ncbi:MAG: hypothetical protein ACRENB_11835 [Gemmatimonadales bacterium]
MGDQSPQTLDDIEGLLASRQQLAGWLDRLDQAGSKAPEVVRAKVRGDYQGRLAQVTAQLRTYADQVGAKLGGLRAQATELRQVRAEEIEVRAEAELRHSVGEYTDEEWQVIELRSSSKISGFDQEIERLSGEIRYLESVQVQIGISAPQSAPRPEEASRAEIVVTHGSADMPPMLDQDPLAPAAPPPLTLVRDEPPAEEAPAATAPRPEAPKFTPRPGAPRPRESGPARSIPFPAPSPAPGQPDELAFLRSVSLDAAPPSARLTPHPAPNAAGMFDKDERPSQVVAKTLKCGECGTLNRPTEWYCERCGAELAAL